MHARYSAPRIMYALLGVSLFFENFQEYVYKKSIYQLYLWIDKHSYILFYRINCILFHASVYAHKWTFKEFHSIEIHMTLDNLDGK